MTVLHTETLKRWGGQQNRVLLEAVGLNTRGHRAIIACNRGSALARKAKESGVDVYEVNMTKQAHVRTIPSLMGIIKKENVELVSTHSSVDSWAGGLAARLTGRRLVRFRHNLYPVGRDPLTWFIYGIPHRIIAISAQVKEVLTGCGIQGRKISVVPSSVDTEKYNPDVDDLRDEIGLPRDAIIIGNTSTFTELKGQEYLLQAFNIIHRRHPCYLLFAGDLEEPFRSQYLSHVEEGLRDRVVFLGHREDIPRVLKTLDIFVFPSFLEGLGTALLEAMVMGLPVAVSNIPTFREFIQEKSEGIFFAPKNAGDIAEKVIALMKDHEMRRRLGNQARVTALKKFSIGTMIDLTETRYREVLNAV